MTESILNTILTIDEQTNTFTPAAHNLFSEQAEAKVAELQAQGLKVQMLPQGSRHKGRSLKSCEPCKNAAQNLSQKPIEGTAEEEQTEEP